MTWSDVSDDPVDFDKAIEQFRKLTPISDAAYERLTARAKRKAFKVAGLAQLDVVQDTFSAIDDAIAKGTDLDDFKAAVGDAIETAWRGTVENPGWRLETIFRTNVQRSYSEGRYRQATDPDVLVDRPYWQFDAVMDDATTDVCDDCSGTVLPADDPWWDEHQPPLHFNCRSTIITLTDEQAAAVGVTDKPPKGEADDGFGAPPVDEADDDQEQGDFEPDLSDYDAGLRREFERQQEAAPPPPEPKRAEHGVHYEDVTRRGLSDAESEHADAALAALTEHDLLDELEATPIRHVRLVKKITDKDISRRIRDRVNGFCRSNGELTLRMQEQAGGFTNRPFEAGTSFSIASAADDWQGAVKRNMLHEVGHHLHFTGGAEVDATIKRAYDSTNRQAITRYGTVDHYEYWAETFSAHRIYPDELEAHDPSGAQMVREVLRLRRKLR